MEVEIFYKITANVSGVDIPAKISMKFPVKKMPESYQELIDSLDKECFLNYLKSITPVSDTCIWKDDLEFITPEEYNQNYDDDDNEN